MLEFDRSPWINIHPDLSLYRYQGAAGRPVKAVTPVLMLHGPMTSHRTWDVLGDFLWRNGFGNIYAVDIADVQMGASLRNALAHLGDVVRWLLAQYGEAADLILIGHSTGGVLARRYVLRAEEGERVKFLFSLGSPHSRTHFSYQVYVPPEEDLSDTRQGVSGTGSSMVITPQIPKDTFLINIFGNAVGPAFDGVVHGVFLPDAINIELPLAHAELKYDPRVMAEMLAYLRGERFRIQLYLHSLYMRTPDQDHMVGPFYFEVNGMRSPADGIFEAVADHHYTFDENSTPLATLAYPVGQALASTVFRLKDLSRARPIRRRLFAKLLDSLGEDEVAIHEMQDNEGSLITVRVRTQHMPTLLRDE